MTGRHAFAAALLAASACSPGASPSGEAERQEARSEPPAETAAPAAIAEARPAARPVAGRVKTGERRCGWLSNPTPANWWLTDREGQWILGSQGADQAPGMEDMPDMSSAGWVETNGHYGYGCACMTITADGEGRVTRIADAQPKPLKQCQADGALPKPE